MTTKSLREQVAEIICQCTPETLVTTIGLLADLILDEPAIINTAWGMTMHRTTLAEWRHDYKTIFALNGVKGALESMALQLRLTIVIVEGVE